MAASEDLMVYCVVPRDLAHLHEPLRRHFRDDPDVEVVVERRLGDRRSSEERRLQVAEREAVERRRVHAPQGRRVADQRAPAAAVAPRDLPRKARPFSERLVFIERVVPSDQHAEDVEIARLVTRFQAGEQEVFAELYTRYFDRVYGYLLVALNNTHEAEDVTQQVFLKLLSALPRYEFRGQPFRAWLFRIVRNLALDTHEKYARLELTAPDELSRRAEDTPLHNADLDALGWLSDREILMFVDRLPLAQRQVLVLRFMLGLDTREIAEVLERDPADVRMLQSRALRFLKERLTRVGHASAKQIPRARMRVCVRPQNVLRARRFALR